MFKELLIIMVFAFHLSDGWSQSITGLILDENQNPMIGAIVVLMPGNTSTVTDIRGQFSFHNIEQGKYDIIVSYVGYTTETIEIGLNGLSEEGIIIRLKIKGELLDIIHITDEHAKQEMTLMARHFSQRLLEENLQGTFSQSIEKVPGINAINVGVGIAKPVIRGLSSNRILVNQQGIKQESHQWGADHGLEVDQFDVERVEIIKGPASLQYGSDALGGVINILPYRILPKNSFEGSVQTIFKTNNDLYGASLHAGINVNDIFITARYSRQEYADYRVPADQFIYNTFVLPIHNERLKNTAGKEENFRVESGIKRNWGISRIIFSHYSLDAGLFTGAVGIPRSYSLVDDGNLRNIEVPKQEVDHYRLSWHHTQIFGEDHLDIKVGYQHNIRKERSFPEFHNIPKSSMDPNNTLALQLNLSTLSASVHYEQQKSDERKNIWGISVQMQENIRGGFAFLLPDFQTFRSGIFGLSEWKLTQNVTFNAGLRADFGTNSTTFYRQFIWDSNENVIDSLIAPVTSPAFFNWSGSLGSNVLLLEKKLILKGNMGKSFRVPYPSEMVSNGIHHGTFRHEIGTQDLVSEHGYQFDLSAEFTDQTLSFNVATYFNYYNNYIYLGPTFPASFSPLPEAGQVFRYRQDNAIFTGFELQYDWIPIAGVSISQSADYVRSYNTNTGLALPFTPQPSLKSQVRYTFQPHKGIDEFFVESGHQIFFGAEGPSRIDRSEIATPGYQLWHISAGLKAHINHQPFQINFQVHNLLDTFYFNHLSRYRLINIPEQGRNLVFSLKIPFVKSLK